MLNPSKLDKVAISVKSHKLLLQLLEENPELKQILTTADNHVQVHEQIRKMALVRIKSRPVVIDYYEHRKTGVKALQKLKWSDYAAIRILDYIDHADRRFTNLNLKGAITVNNPFRLLWLAVTNGTGGCKPEFFEDMIYLFRQFSGKMKPVKPRAKQICNWMSRWPSGLSPTIIQLRNENRQRILKIIIQKLDQGIISDSQFKFESGMLPEEKYQLSLKWWDDYRFHLKFAVRDPESLNEMLDYSLSSEVMQVLNAALEAGIPFFINPYYLSLLNIRTPDFAVGADLAIRNYIIYSQQLVDEFGDIVAWEKEDVIQPGKPNAAGWILPLQDHVHRRYPDVAIMIPATMGRACGGLCSTCQRMYSFQSGVYSFDLEALLPDEKWPAKLEKIMDYFEHDAQIRDILITGGDALMSSDKSLKKILDRVYVMARDKRQANQRRKDGEKYAEIQRVRLGTRLPAYLPQRITPELIQILKKFKTQASKIGVQQFIVQTHFESPMEITPESRQGIARLQSAGWLVTNQHVFTTAASRRGHTAKLRQVLNHIGILPYYTFTVKGFMENYHSFSPNARSIQEQLEEKRIGHIPLNFMPQIKTLPDDAENIVQRIDQLRTETDLPFLAMGRNVLNLPGVGKSMTFRVIGISRYGKRILEFDHDHTRSHSPIIKKMGKIVIIESKSISEYLRQLEDMGEDIREYANLWGYSIGETEPRNPVFDYPDYPFTITKEMTNLDLTHT